MVLNVAQMCVWVAIRKKNIFFATARRSLDQSRPLSTNRLVSEEEITYTTSSMYVYIYNIFIFRYIHDICNIYIYQIYKYIYLHTARNKTFA